MSLRRLGVFVAVIGLVASIAPVSRAAVGTDAPSVPGRALVAAHSSERAQAERSITERGGRIVSYYAAGGFFVVDTPGDAPAWAASARGAPGIRYAEPDYVLQADVMPTETTLSDGTLWGMTKISAPAAWDVSKGSTSSVVGIIDTGVDYTHPDLTKQMWVNPGEIPANRVDDDSDGFVDNIHGADCINNDGDPMDDNSHGTHVAGTIGASANDGGVVGVNWTVTIMALKFLGASGSGSTLDAIECLDFAIREGVDVTNNSWGGGGYSQALSDAIGRARVANQLFIAAAGNSSANTDTSPHYPSSYTHDNIISVASTTSTDALSSFSNYGATSVDLAAPGSSIYSTIPNASYGTKSGTSMAAPHVAGAAALLLATAPAASYTYIRDRLLATVDPLASLSGKVATGGRLNVGAALAPPPAPDVTAPIITAGPGPTNITSNGATISWTTDEASSSSVSYRTTSGAPSGSASSAARVLNHAVGLTGLAPETIYYYTVTSTDAAGNSVTSSEVWFTTTAGPPPLAVATQKLEPASKTGKFWVATLRVSVTSAGAVVAGASVSLTVRTGDCSGSSVASGSGTTNEFGYVDFTFRTKTTATFGAATTASKAGYANASGCNSFTML